MTHHRADLPPSGFAPAEVSIPVYLHVQSRRAGKIKGEARAPGHVDEIEVLAWQWGAQASAVMNGTTSMGRSQCTYRALTIHKRFDTATTALMWALVRNDELREVRLTMRRPASSDGVQEDVFTITLGDARVVALDHEAAADGSTREGVTIASKVVQTHYQSGKPRRLVVAHRLPAPQPVQKAIAPALGNGAPGVRSFREESMAQRKLDDAKALAEYQARLASQPMQYAGPIDDAGNARAATAQQRTANNLAAALGGPFVAAPMLTARAAGLDEYQVEQAGMLGLAALDAAGVKGGMSVTRLGSRPRGPVGLTPAEQAGRLARAGDTPEGAALFRNKFPADAIGLQKIVPNERLAGINGNFNYVVTAEGKLIVGRSGHTSLAGGLDVRAAGEVQLYKGNIKWIDNMSGHYQPSGPGLSVVAERAFNDIGLNATGKFVTRKFQ